MASSRVHDEEIISLSREDYDFEDIRMVVDLGDMGEQPNNENNGHMLAAVNPAQYIDEQSTSNNNNGIMPIWTLSSSKRCKIVDISQNPQFVQYNDKSERFEVTRGQWIKATLMIPFGINDHLNFSLRHCDTSDPKAVIKSCHEHPNPDFNGAAFSVDGKGLSKHNEMAGEHFKVLVHPDGPVETINIQFHCLSSEVFNRGNKESMRKWKLVIDGQLNGQYVEQEIPLQVFIMLRKLDRLKKKRRHDSGDSLAKPVVPVKTETDDLRDKLCHYYVSQVQDFVKGLTTEELEAAWILRKKSKFFN